MNDSFSIVDALSQIVFLGLIAVIVILVVSLVRYIKRRRHQLDRMERMLDDLHKQLKN